MSLAELRALAAESYDGVRQKVWTEPDPAAGADFTITVPGPQFWFPVALRATLTASDAVVARLPALQVTDGTTVVADAPSVGEVDASGAVTFTWLRSYPLTTGSDPQGINLAPFPDVVLPTGWVVRSLTTGIDDADQWSGIALTALQITGGQPAQRGRRETAIREHARALYELSEGR